MNCPCCAPPSLLRISILPIREFDGTETPHSSKLRDDLLTFLGKPLRSNKFCRSWCEQAISYYSSIGGIRPSNLQYSLGPNTAAVFGVALLGLSVVCYEWLEGGSMSAISSQHGESLLHLVAIGGFPNIPVYARSYLGIKLMQTSRTTWTSCR